MGLSLLTISEFRNLASAKLAPVTEGFNFVWGKNGSGKTSLLEAIYYLSLARSFRSTHADRVVRYTADKLSIFGHLIDPSKQSTVVGLERHADGMIKFRVNGQEKSSASELASYIPVQLIDSQCHNLLDSGPIFRRKYLDFGLFYQTNDFLRTWRHFERTLKQRNAALRARAPLGELAIWTQELVASAVQLDQLREEYVNAIVPLLTCLLAELLPLPALKISYYKGWNQDTFYPAVLHKNREKDYQLGHTQYGPHKADLRIIINDIPAKDILSRGQQKLFVCAMILARGILLKNHGNKAPIYLVDDLPAELDAVSRARLIGLLSRQKAQVFVTATDDRVWRDSLISAPMKMFHVEHGQVSEITMSEAGA